MINSRKNNYLRLHNLITILICLPIQAYTTTKKKKKGIPNINSVANYEYIH